VNANHVRQAGIGPRLAGAKGVHVGLRDLHPPDVSPYQGENGALPSATQRGSAVSALRALRKFPSRGKSR